MTLELNGQIIITVVAVIFLGLAFFSSVNASSIYRKVGNAILALSCMAVAFGVWI